MIIEVKNSKNKNSRVKRQISNAGKIITYLLDDKIQGLYGIEGTMHRFAPSKKEKSYGGIINRLIQDSIVSGYAIKKVEPGVIYGVFREAENPDEMFSKLNFTKFHQPIACMLNTDKFPEQGYYPLSLSINNGKDYLDFLEGKLIIMVVINIKRILDMANKHGYSVLQTDRHGYFCEFKPQSNNNETGAIVMSEHYFARAFYEFVSVSWLLSETFKRPSDAEIMLLTEKQRNDEN